MKTRRLAMAAERGRIGERRAQAWGFVSRIIVRREGGGSVDLINVSSLERWVEGAYRQMSCRSGLSHRLRS